jgi:hypothetical protein
MQSGVSTACEQLDDVPHLLGLVLPLGERDADVEQVRAALDLPRATSRTPS